MKKDFAVDVLIPNSDRVKARARHGSLELHADQDWPRTLRGNIVRIEVTEPGKHRGAVLNAIHIRSLDGGIALMHSPFPFYEYADA